MISRSAVSALNGFLTAALDGQPSTRPIGFRGSPAPDQAGTSSSCGLHFSVGEGPTRSTHLVLRAVVRDGEPVLLGCLFDGLPLVVARQAEDWLRDPTFECGGAIATPASTVHGARHLGDDVAREERATVDHYLGSLQQIKALLAARGINLDGRSRLASYSDALRRYARRSSDRDVRDGLRAVHEVRQLDLIFSQLHSDLTDPECKMLASGQFSPESEPLTGHTPGRDRQFELYLAAGCRRSGLPVAVCEPDTIANVAGFRIAIASKRVKSPRQLTRRFKAAQRQTDGVAGDDVIGMVAMDLTPILNPEFRYLRVHSGRRASEIANDLLEAFMTQNLQAIEGLAGPRLGGFLGHVTFPTLWVGQEIGSITVVQMRGTLPPCPRRDAVREFARALVHGLS